MSYNKPILHVSGQEFSHEYWNDPKEEENKVWSTWMSDFDNFIKNKKVVSLNTQFKTLTNTLNTPMNGSKILSLGSGICVLECMILKASPQIKKMTCLEFSRHRIHDHAPKLAERFGIPEDQIEFLLGSFYDIGSLKEKYDIVILSQAFHHANDPSLLLQSVSSILNKHGKVIIIGEHYFSPKAIFKKFIKHFVKFFINFKGYRKHNPFIPSWRTLYPIDNVKGDHHYTVNLYEKMFSGHGFKFKRFIFKELRNQAFILYKDETFSL